jgi:hypothetical protein
VSAVLSVWCIYGVIAQKRARRFSFAIYPAVDCSTDFDTLPSPLSSTGRQLLRTSYTATHTEDQSLNDLQGTLQSEDANGNSVDTTQIDQSLNDLQNSLQGTDVPTPTPDTLDQDLNSLQQTLQAQSTP